jgi:hypothetical protein
VAAQTWPPKPAIWVWATLQIATSRGFLLQGELDERQVRSAAETLLADAVTETTLIAPVGDAQLPAPFGVA